MFKYLMVGQFDDVVIQNYTAFEIPGLHFIDCNGNFVFPSQEKKNVESR